MRHLSTIREGSEVSQTLGSDARVRWNRPKDRLDQAQFDKDILEILDLLVEVRHLWQDAVDGGAYPQKTGSGRPSSFEDTDPTYSAATRPAQRQLRGSARYAAGVIAEVKVRLEDAADALHRGMFRTDPEVLRRDLEKRAAATQRITRL